MVLQTKGSALGEIALASEVPGSDAGKLHFKHHWRPKHKFNGWADLF